MEHCKPSVLTTVHFSLMAQSQLFMKAKDIAIEARKSPQMISLKSRTACQGFPVTACLFNATDGVQTGNITANQFVAYTSTNPAKIFGLYPRKGALVPGADADVVIWDPEKRVKYGVAQSHQRTDYSLYEGWELVGYPEKVFLRGKVIVDGEKMAGQGWRWEVSKTR